ncbi:MAG: 23S rRNA (adenine(2503)-C(2))-methyltransferase RlmN [Terracidiphilus sp.]|nr:23S rRNA (adenine(2503)-C(2))-methyltransferase RlmN [Terracidiphilus sp.]MDR3798501.1 23S rRNA (adenine(2503)-C(2))-methyltransferase RlmN [Terracidiphilus sp.]
MREKPAQLVSLDAADAPGGFREPLFGLDAESLSKLLISAGEPAFRSKQLAEAMYRQWLREISEITTLPVPLRAKMASEGWQIGRPAIARAFQSVDGTERYLIEFAGSDAKGKTAEAVWMPEGDGGEAGDEDRDQPGQPVASPSPQHLAERVGEHNLRSSLNHETRDWSRATICISSQVGCAVNCQFCLTAKLGLQRNLTAGEIAGQVVAILDRHAVRVGRDRVNLVFMGMGEPFLNYDNFMAAVRLLVREVGLSPRRMTVSTSGIVPGIERFAQEQPDLRPHLAISLNAPNDTIRAEIMPINRKWPINEVIKAVRRVPLRPRERITFEYVLLGGVTDRPEHAREVARLVRRSGLSAKVNLIAWNPGPGIAYTMPSPEAVVAFHKLLVEEGIPAYIRQPRGRDIFAACGQLKRTVEE